MKRTSIYYFSLAAILAGSFVSCQDDDMGFTKEEIHDAAVMREYVKNFEARYGKIDPNHDWGLGMISNAETRAADVNLNQWYGKYNFAVPGYPDVYYSNTTPTPTLHNTNFRDANGYQDHYTGQNPIGDITDEEIMYVSWWFRTHRYPVSTPLHWTDFWMQSLSRDNDRDADGFIVDNIPLYDSKEIRPQKNDAFSIDQLKVKTFDAPSYDVESNTGYDHIQNFNAGNQNLLNEFDWLPVAESDIYQSYTFENYGDIKVENGKTRAGYDKRTMQLYLSSGTEDFAGHYSNDSKWRYNAQNYEHSIWTTVHLHFVGASGRIYDGYYLGFDYMNYDQGGKQELMMDGYYSNWILKLSPGMPIDNSTHTRRIMCEDLGNTFDFDFDDVVFDVRYIQDQISSGSTITIQAAGGTMPIWVGKKPEKVNGEYDMKYEVHHLLGQSVTDKPINIGSSYTVAPPANYHLPALPAGTAIFDVPIYVYNTKDEILKELSLKAFEKYSKTDETNSGNIPQKFGVPTSVLWMQETEQIENGYSQFASWVRSENENAEWYKTIKNVSLLWGTEGEPSSTAIIGGVSSTVNPVIPVSTAESPTYDIYIRRGTTSQTQKIADRKRKGDSYIVSVPHGGKCVLTGSFKIGDTVYRSHGSDILTIYSTTTITVLGQVYILEETN